MVYFIQSSNGPIKIGSARSPSKRLKSLQSSNAAKLTLLGTIPGNKSEELHLHKKFESLKISGEWFNPGQELLRYIAVSSVLLQDEEAPVLLPKLLDILQIVGENIKLARLRRKISAEILAERADLTRVTLRKVESGDPGTSMGAYASAMFCLGLEKEVEKFCQDDVLGRKLQDADLLRKRSSKRKS